MSDASRRMAAGDGRASRHPSRRKPSPLGEDLLLRMRSESKDFSPAIAPKGPLPDGAMGVLRIG